MCVGVHVWEQVGMCVCVGVRVWDQVCVEMFLSWALLLVIAGSPHHYGLWTSDFPACTACPFSTRGATLNPGPFVLCLA